MGFRLSRVREGKLSILAVQISLDLHPAHIAAWQQATEPQWQLMAAPAAAVAMAQPGAAAETVSRDSADGTEALSDNPEAASGPVTWAAAGGHNSGSTTGPASPGNQACTEDRPSERGDAAEPSKAADLELQPGSQQPGGSAQRQMARLRIESALHLSGSPAWYGHSHKEPRVRLFVRVKTAVPGEQAWQCSTPPAIPVPSSEPGSFSADWHHQDYLSVSTDTTLCCEVSQSTVRLCLWRMLQTLLSSVWRWQR